MVGQDLVVGLHGRVLYLCGRDGNQCMAADAFRHLVKLRPLAGYIRYLLAHLGIPQFDRHELVNHQIKDHSVELPRDGNIGSHPDQLRQHACRL